MFSTVTYDGIQENGWKHVIRLFKINGLDAEIPVLPTLTSFNICIIKGSVPTQGNVLVILMAFP